MYADHSGDQPCADEQALGSNHLVRAAQRGPVRWLVVGSATPLPFVMAAAGAYVAWATGWSPVGGALAGLVATTLLLGAGWMLLAAFAVHRE